MLLIQSRKHWRECTSAPVHSSLFPSCLPVAYVAWSCLRTLTTSFITFQPSDFCATEYLLIEKTTEKPWNIGRVVLRPRGYLKYGSNHSGKQVNESLCRGTHRIPCTVNLVRAVISHFPIPYLEVEEVGKGVEENSHKMLNELVFSALFQASLSSREKVSHECGWRENQWRRKLRFYWIAKE